MPKLSKLDRFIKRAQRTDLRELVKDRNPYTPLVFRSLITAFVALAIASCDSQERTELPAPDPSTSMQDHPTPSGLKKYEMNGETFYEFDFGDSRFRFPAAEVNPTFNNSHLTVFLGWPGPRVVRGYGQPDLLHFIHLVVSAESKPISQFNQERLESTIRNRGLLGPIRNEALGLLEYRRISPPWSLYVSINESYRGRDGTKPFALCDPTPTKYWGNTRQCRVDQYLSPQIRYYYTFSDALLPVWSTVDAGVRQFLASKIVVKN